VTPNRSLLVFALTGLGLASLWAGGTGCGHATPAAPANPDPLASAPAELLLKRGRAYAAAGDTIRAEQYLVAASRRGAGDHLVAPVLIGTCIRGQRYRAALAHTERFVRRHPRDIQLRQLSAVLYMATGSPHRAEAALRKVVADHPDEPRPRKLLARAEREVQRMRDGDDLDDTDRLSPIESIGEDEPAAEAAPTRKKASKRHRSKARRSRRARR
jgi:predicted Zn-dependent protease